MVEKKLQELICVPFYTNTRYVYINKDKVKLIMKKLIKHWPIIKKIFLNRRTRTFSINQKLFH